MCTVLMPVMVAGPAIMLKLTAKPELAVALTVKSTSPYVLLERAPNVIVWDVLTSVSVPKFVELRPPVNVAVPDSVMLPLARVTAEVGRTRIFCQVNVFAVLLLDFEVIVTVMAVDVTDVAAKVLPVAVLLIL
jgi:hypothetical protein